MQLSFEYDRSYFPAFPILELTISNASGGSEQTIQGLIDSGSELALLLQTIPYRLI